MKRSLALLLPLVAVAATVLADDKPKSFVSVAVTTRHRNTPRPKQVAQYGLCDNLKHWGMEVQSRVGTPWDAFLKKAGVVVVAPPAADKKDEKKDEPKVENPAFTIEGTIDLLPHKVPFYGHEVDVICISAKVDVVVKDAQGKELKKIAWENLHGLNKDAGEEKVLGESEKRAVRFLIRDVLMVKEIADLVPKEKKDELEKFLKAEDDYYKENYDDTTKHRTDEKPADEKK